MAEFIVSPTDRRGTPSRLTDKAGNPLVDPSLFSILQAAAASAPSTISKVVAFSGKQGRVETFNHPRGWAVDVMLYDANGNLLNPNIRSTRGLNAADLAAYKQYEQFAQVARQIQQENFGDLSNRFRWGGYFGSSYPGDLMHFDISGGMSAKTPPQTDRWLNGFQVGDLAGVSLGQRALVGVLQPPSQIADFQGGYRDVETATGAGADRATGFAGDVPAVDPITAEYGAGTLTPPSMATKPPSAGQEFLQKGGTQGRPSGFGFGFSPAVETPVAPPLGPPPVAATGVTQPSMPSSAGMMALGLTPQEQNLYQHHLANLGNGTFVRNSNGSISTLYQTSAEINGRVYNFPTVWDGQILPPDQAIQRAIQEGGLNAWPSYPSEGAAEHRYAAMHEEMAKDVAELPQAATGVTQPSSVPPQAATGLTMATVPPSIAATGLTMASQPPPEAATGLTIPTEIPAVAATGNTITEPPPVTIPRGFQTSTSEFAPTPTGNVTEADILARQNATDELRAALTQMLSEPAPVAATGVTQPSPIQAIAATGNTMATMPPSLAATGNTINWQPPPIAATSLTTPSLPPPQAATGLTIASEPAPRAATGLTMATTPPPVAATGNIYRETYAPSAQPVNQSASALRGNEPIGLPDPMEASRWPDANTTVAQKTVVVPAAAPITQGVDPGLGLQALDLNQEISTLAEPAPDPMDVAENWDAVGLPRESMATKPPPVSVTRPSVPSIPMQRVEIPAAMRPPVQPKSIFQKGMDLLKNATAGFGAGFNLAASASRSTPGLQTLGSYPQTAAQQAYNLSNPTNTTYKPSNY